MVQRRELLVAGATVLAVRLGGVATADEKAPMTRPASGGLAAAAADCVRVGERCLQHCLDLLAAGDQSLGECAKSVNQMLAVCKAVGPLADAGSKHLAALARVCRDVCSDCERECRKHESHHDICKQCAEACARTVAEAQKIA
jgi:Cys-rich four helix bundle protein (predicted Tat secretion target)